MIVSKLYVTVSLKKIFTLFPRRNYIYKNSKKDFSKRKQKKNIRKIFNHGSKHGFNDLSLEKKGELYDLFRRNIKKRKVF